MSGASGTTGADQAADTSPTLKALLTLAGPMILARATQAVVAAADTYQVAHLGPEAVAATATGAAYAGALIKRGKKA